MTKQGLANAIFQSHRVNVFFYRELIKHLVSRRWRLSEMPWLG